MSAAELTRKKKQRGGHRSSTTRTINQTYDNLRAAEGINLPKLKQQETTLKEKLGILKDLDAEILALLPEDDIEDEIKEQDEYRESIQLALYDIEAGMKPASPRPASPRPHSPRPLEPRASPTPTTTSESTTSNPVGTVSTFSEAVTPAATTVTTAVTTTTSSASVATKTRVKLPKITLRRFEGNSLHWTAFWGTLSCRLSMRTQNSVILISSIT